MERDSLVNKTVVEEQPLPEEITSQQWYPLEEVFKRIEKKLNEHYYVDERLVFS